LDESGWLFWQYTFLQHTLSAAGAPTYKIVANLCVKRTVAARIAPDSARGREFFAAKGIRDARAEISA